MNNWKVYLIQAGDLPERTKGRRGKYTYAHALPIKIGVSVDTKKRIDSLQVGNHLHLSVMAEIPAESKSHAYAIENYLHRRLKYCRLQGEWFDGNQFSIKSLIRDYNNEKYTSKAKVKKAGVKSDKQILREENQRLEREAVEALDRITAQQYTIKVKL